MNFENDIPATSKPDLCQCGEPAKHTIEGSVEILGKIVPVKKRVCSAHAAEMHELYGLVPKGVDNV